MTIAGLDPVTERVLTAANKAPSGENCQPWRFVVTGAVIELYIRSERDQSPYSWGQRASYLACGAALENMQIAASAEGVACEIVYFPRANSPALVAVITLKKGTSVVKDSLSEAVLSRTTNRKPYQTTPLKQHDKELLERAMPASSEITLRIVEGTEKLRVLGRVGSTNEELMLGNRAMHQFFFSHVSWTKKEDDEKKIGFYIKTLELPPPAQIIFKLIRRWGIMQLFHGINFESVVARQNAATNASASAFGAVSISDMEPVSFVRAGRVIERIWLTATSLGLSLQPLTGVLFLYLGMLHGQKGFSLAEKKKISDAYAQAASMCGVDESRRLVFMFRVGYAGAPSASAVRFPLAEVVQVAS